MCDKGQVHEFNCDVCRLRGYDKDRACFRFRNNGLVCVVAYGPGGPFGTSRTTSRKREDVWRILDGITRKKPELDPLHILIHILNVCPEGMIGPDVADYIEQEMVSETYKTPPVSGGVEDWPAKLYDAFTTIRRTHQQIKAEKNKEVLARLNTKPGGKAG